MSSAWVTLATTDGYAIGALVLAQSLRNVRTQHKLHVLTTADVSIEMREQLKQSFDEVTEANIFDSYDAENLALIGRPDLGVTFTKLHCWRLTQYDKCVFLDADTFVLKNSDELFEHPEFSAAPDIGWPDYFNSGVFVFVPSQTTYQNLVRFALDEGSFDGGDQGLLNKFFSGWRSADVRHRLSFLYNVTANAIYSYAAAIKRHAADIKIIHFLGQHKPWHFRHDAYAVSQHLREWQRTYTEAVQQSLPLSLTAMNIIQKRITEETLPVIGSQLRHMKFTQSAGGGTAPGCAGEQHYDAWEQGRPDYKGRDAFDNIQKAINKSLQ